MTGQDRIRQYKIGQNRTRHVRAVQDMTERGKVGLDRTKEIKTVLSVKLIGIA